MENFQGNATTTLKPCMNLFASEPGVIVPTPNRRKCEYQEKNDIRSIILEALEEVDQLR